MQSSQTPQLWLELGPLSATAPRRLLVFLHGAGSSPEVFAPIALAWQLKFPGATAAILQGLTPSRPQPDTGSAAVSPGFDWVDPARHAVPGEARITEAARQVSGRLESLHQSLGLDSSHTVLIGFSQGASVALELARIRPELTRVVVAYAGRLLRRLAPAERCPATVHLIHGELDSVVPHQHAQSAYRQLAAAGADVTLDIVADETHSIGQELVSLGATRVLQTLFRGRSRAGSTAPVLH